jgi:TctA family transporter
MSAYASRIERLRALFDEAKIDGFLISQPESRFYLSGYTGHDLPPRDSAGYLMIGKRGALLLTDPRTSQLAYGVIVGYLFATVLTLLVQVWGMSLFVRLVYVPYHVLVPGILVLCALGAYVLNNRLFDVWVLLGFGLLGYFLVKHGFELAPFIIGFLLGPIAEINVKRALQASSDPTLFLTRPISALLLLLAAAAVAYYFYVGLRSTHRQAPIGQPAPAADA